MARGEATILVADDEEAVRGMVGRAFAPWKFRVLGARDGDETVALARAELPALVVLDLAMPGKGGLAALEEMRACSGTRWIPVLVLTGSLDPGEKAAVLELGADDYVTKPFSPRELAARGRGLIRSSAGGMSQLAGLPGGAALEAETARRVAAGVPFAFLRFEIGGLGKFNSLHGFPAGDRLIRAAGGIVLSSLTAKAGRGWLAGHIGGGVFGAVCAPADAEDAAAEASRRFDLASAGLSRGAGTPCLRIGIATTARRRLGHQAAAFDVARELVAYIKKMDKSGRSAYFVDRRTDPLPACP